MTTKNNPYMDAAFADQNNENKLALGMLYQQIINKDIVPTDLDTTKAHFDKVFDIINRTSSSSVQVSSAMNALTKSLTVPMTPEEFDMSMLMYTMAAFRR
jgi:hypothetical protein